MSMKKNHMEKALRKANEILDLIDLQLNDDDVNPKELRLLIESLNELPLPGQTHMVVSKILEKAYGYEVISRKINLTIANVANQMTCEQYEELKEMCREDPILYKALCEVAPSNV